MWWDLAHLDGPDGGGRGPGRAVPGSPSHGWRPVDRPGDGVRSSLQDEGRVRSDSACLVLRDRFGVGVSQDRNTGAR